MQTHTLVRGAIAGVAATIPMTLVIAAGRAAGLMRTPPPKQIMANAEAAAGMDGARDEAFTARWMISHVAYGVGCGVLYGVARPHVPGGRSNAVQDGLAFGGAIWAASYCVVMPALGVFPWPWDDDHTRTAVMIAAHGVFGVALAAASARLDAFSS